MHAVRQRADGEAQDGNVEETMILCRSVSVRDVMAEAGHNYSFFAGFAPMKHKCDLVINIRSQVRDGQVMPPLVRA